MKVQDYLQEQMMNKIADLFFISEWGVGSRVGL